ncbi:MAG: acylphosphatase [Candidatus Bathyarchaeia archaeon]|nr:acylphosphatase [Candidatus Bathyarchaeia archaeon]
MQAYRLRVYGKVQRVGFRRQILDIAQELNLSGHAKNLPDGSIEIFIQGEKEQITKFLETLKNPLPPAKVMEIKSEETAVNPEIKQFKLVYGELGEELQEEFGTMQTIFAEYWEDFKDYRGEFKDYRREFKNFRQEFRDYREEFRDFVKRTDENFKLISNKYGEISEKMTVILQTLIKESRETREMLNETMKMLKEALEKLGK